VSAVECCPSQDMMISHGLGVLALVGPPATLPRIHRAGQPVMVWSLEDPLSSLTSLVQDVGLDGVIEWSDIDSVVMTANMREDAFGIVGGSYYSIFFAAVLSGSLAAHAIQNQMLRRAPPRANFFEWMAGSALPSLDELQTACVPIAMGDGRDLFLCAEESLFPAGACGEDEEFSEYYGQPVYVCHL